MATPSRSESPGGSVTLGRVTDTAAAAQLMKASWQSHPGGALDYSPAFLQACLTPPSDLPAIAPAYYDGEEMVAMVCGMPRRVSMAGAPLNLLLITFFTVAQGQQGRGLGHALWTECLRQAHDAGYDGAFHYCADGNISNHVTTAAAERAGYVVNRVFEVQFLMRLLKGGDVPAGVEEWSPDAFVAAAGQRRELNLARTWSVDEARWHCSRPGAIAVTTATADGPGAIAGHVAPVLDQSGLRSVSIEDVLWHGLPAQARERLLSTFIGAAASHGADALSVPQLGYADLTAFRTAGFRKTRRLVHAYLTQWTAAPAVPFDAMYLDVL